MAAAGLLVLGACLPARVCANSFVNFESGQVRPLALSPDGALLFALNTPDARLAIFRVTAAGLRLASEVPVGLEPVAVAVRSGAAGLLDAWVVNHLSDSVSVVRVQPRDPTRAHVEATLLVGDEPRDVVFGGARRDRAFVTTARRGQHLPSRIDPALTTTGVPRALVWVFDANDPFADTGYDADTVPSPLGGEPLTILELFGDSPRALAVSPDGRRVYAAIFLSGNRTTIVDDGNVDANGGLPPPPRDSPYYPDRLPTTSLIVRFDPGSGQWRDELGRDWSRQLRQSLPDSDVFTIDADATPPTLLPGATVSGIGTVLYDMAVRPDDGAIFVANTEARNDVRFEPLIDATHGLQSRFVDNRVTVITTDDGAPGRVQAVGLNPHADRNWPRGPPEEVAASIALPTSLAFSPDGHLLYVTAFGSERVALIDADDLEAGIVTRTLVPVGGGPSGLELDHARARLYVLNRFDQTISVIADADDPAAARVRTTVRLGFDPSPQAVKRGRRFLFDGRLSGHGDVSCGSCHVFADVDGLAWDLGNPYGPILPNPNLAGAPPWHPMKGPMVTQSLRGLAGTGPLHWRGDRTAASTGGSRLDTDGALKRFNPAFIDLLGGVRQLTTVEMQEFTDWVLTIRYPPNPVARLDGMPTDAEARGAAFFTRRNGCSFCHALPLGTKGASVILGTEGRKIPHLRNLYTKVGMFGQQDEGILAQPFLGDQIRGFGFFHSGANAVPDLPLVLLGGAEARHVVPDVHAYLMAFPTGLAPIVGQQVSATPASVADPATLARRDLLVARSEAGDCDLIVKGMVAGSPFGALHRDAGAFETDRGGAAHLMLGDIWRLAGSAGAEQLWTCVPPGSGRRMGVDRDEDGFSDGDEFDAGTSPIDPANYPGGPVITTIATSFLRVKDNPSRRRFRFSAIRKRRAIVPPSPGSTGDPTASGATVRVYNGAGSGEQQTFALPAAGWRTLRNGFAFRSRETGITSVRITPGRIRITGENARFGYTLDEPAQRTMVVRLTLGNAVDWCAEAVATATRGTDSVGRFEVRRAPAPPDCQAPPAGAVAPAARRPSSAPASP